MIENNLYLSAVSETSDIKIKEEKIKLLDNGISGFMRAEALIAGSAFHLFNTIQYDDQNIFNSAIIGLANYGGQQWGRLASKLWRNFQKVTPEETATINDYLSEVSGNIIKNGWLKPDENYLNKMDKVNRSYKKNKNTVLARKVKESFSETVAYAKMYRAIKEDFDLKKEGVIAGTFLINLKNNSKTDVLILVDNKLYRTKFDESYVQLEKLPSLPEYLNEHIKTEELDWNGSIDNLTLIMRDYQVKNKNVYFIKNNDGLNISEMKILALNSYFNMLKTDKKQDAD